MRMILLHTGSKMLFRAAFDKCVDLSRPKLFDRMVDFSLVLWSEGIIGVPQISGFCCGVDIFVLCLDLFSSFRSTQSLRVRPSLRSPSLFPSFSLFPCCYFCLLPLSLNLLICSNPVFCPYPPLLFPSFSIPPFLSSPPLPGAMWHT